MAGNRYSIRKCGPARFFFLASILATASFGQNADALFDDSQLHDVYLDMNPADWASLKANFFDNAYYPANLRWRGILIESIGVRSRGSGSRNGEKPGLRVDIDRYEKGQRFLGLKSFILDNVVQDTSYIKERLSMSLFRRMGVPAPREATGRLFVNGEFAGVYGIVESIDKLFLQRELGEDGGHLYEYKWTDEYRFEFKGDDGASYVPLPFKPETEEDDPKPGNIIEFVRFVNESTDDEFQAGISRFLDTGLFARHVAVEHFISEYDGINGYAGMNNFYIYRYKGSDRWQFIPWDKDVTFTDSNMSILFNVPENILTRRLFNLSEFREAYSAALLGMSEIAGGPDGWLVQEVRRASDQIRTAVYSDPFPKCPDSQVSCAAAYFETAVTELQDFGANRSSLVATQMAELGFMPAF
jgi:spore coat protein CotH